MPRVIRRFSTNRYFSIRTPPSSTLSSSLRNSVILSLFPYRARGLPERIVVVRIAFVDELRVVRERVDIVLRQVAQHRIDTFLEPVEAGTEKETRRFSGLAKNLAAVAGGHVDIALDQLGQVDVAHLAGVDAAEAGHLFALHRLFDGFDRFEDMGDLCLRAPLPAEKAAEPSKHAHTVAAFTSSKKSPPLP